MTRAAVYMHVPPLCNFDKSSELLCYSLFFPAGSPGRYAIRYKATDSRERQSYALLLLRVQAAAQYNTVLQFAVSCGTDNSTVEDKVRVQQHSQRARITSWAFPHLFIQGSIQ